MLGFLLARQGEWGSEQPAKFEFILLVMLLTKNKGRRKRQLNGGTTETNM
jgi:hypothetical protein